MVKLTADLIWKCPHFFNALKERELDLRGAASPFFRSNPNPHNNVLKIPFLSFLPFQVTKLL